MATTRNGSPAAQSERSAATSEQHTHKAKDSTPSRNNPTRLIDQCGHIYRLVGSRPHVTRHGRQSAVLTWRGTCADCGGPFEFMTGREFPRYVNRRCRKHRKPRVPALPYEASR